MNINYWCIFLGPGPVTRKKKFPTLNCQIFPLLSFICLPRKIPKHGLWGKSGDFL